MNQTLFLCEEPTVHVYVTVAVAGYSSIDTKMPAVYFVDVSQQLLNNAAIMSYSRKELDFY